MSNLRRLSRSSGYIFDGTVLAVERDTQNETDSVPTVQVVSLPGIEVPSGRRHNCILRQLRAASGI